MARLIALEVVIVFFGLFLSLSSCSAEENKKYLPNVPYYYGSFSGYSIPYKPIEELTYEEASQRDSYYVAHYDKEGKMTSFAKFLYGKFIFIDRYFYYTSGVLERREGVKFTGESYIQYFDEEGNLR